MLHQAIGCRWIWCAVAIGLVAHDAHAQIWTWTGNDTLRPTDWRSIDNWDPRSAPGFPPVGPVDVHIPVDATEFPLLNRPIELLSINAEAPVIVNNNFSLAGDSTMVGPAFGGNSGTSPDVVLGGSLEIDGASLWTRSEFMGLGPLINHGVLRIDPSSGARRLFGTILQNDATVAQNASVELQDLADIENFGTWVMNASLPGSIDPSSEFINTGTVRYINDASRSLALKMGMQGGEIRAESGELRLSGGGVYLGGVLHAADGGQLSLVGAGDSGPSISGDVTATGDGVFVLQQGVTEIQSTLTLRLGPDQGAAIINESAEVDIAGTLRNEGLLRFEMGEVFGSGTLLNTPEGEMQIVASKEKRIGLALRNEGEVLHTGSAHLDEGGLIQSPGSWRLLSGEVRAGIGDLQDVRMEIDGILIGETEQANRVGVPVHILDGGVAAVRGDEVRIRNRLELAAGGQSNGDARMRGGSATTQRITLSGGTFEVQSGRLTVEGAGGLWVADAGVQASAPVQIDSLMHLRSGSLVSGDGGLLVDGRLWMQGTELRDGLVEVRSGGTLFSDREANFLTSSGAGESLIHVETEGTFIINHEITLLAGRIVNQGQVVLQITGKILAPQPESGFVENLPGGVVLAQAIDSGTFGIFATFSNGGLVIADQAKLDIFGPMPEVNDEDELTNGVYVARDQGVIDFHRPVRALVGSSLRGGAAGFPSTAISRIEDGFLTATDAWPLTNPLINEGTTRSEGGLIDADPHDIENGLQELAGLAVLEDVVDPNRPSSGGFRCATLRNGGRVRPGSAEAVGPFRLEGDWSQRADGVLEIEIAGPSMDAHDHVSVSGHASLAGMLDVTMLGGFEPDLSDEFVVMTVSSRTGRFDLVRSPLLADGRRLRAVYSPTSVTLVSTCGADIDGDGNADADDFFTFLDLFSVGDPMADVDADGDVDAEDFFDYLDLFVAGGC